jgi:hypothetical protein
VITPFLTVIGVDTFVAVRAAIRQIVPCCQLLSTTLPNAHQEVASKNNLETSIV